MFNNIELHFSKWAEDMYGFKGWGLNKGIEKFSLLKDFVLYYPQYRSTLTIKAFKKLLLLHCKHHNLQFNPHRTGMVDWRDKSSGGEYYFVCDASFDAGRLERLSMQDPPKKAGSKQRKARTKKALVK